MTRDYDGGAARHGTVFKISLSGNETVRHSFGGSPDGAYRQGELINVHALLYGTTVNGGSASRNGAIYTITTAGVESGSTALDSLLPIRTPQTPTSTTTRAAVTGLTQSLG
jgi:uncharacterized repeat protein (TIGR03803 family)